MPSVYNDKTFNSFFENMGDDFGAALKYTIKHSRVAEFNNVYDSITRLKINVDIEESLITAAKHNDKYYVAKLIDLLALGCITHEMDIADVLKPKKYTSQVKEMIETAIKMYPSNFYNVQKQELSDHVEDDDD